MEFFEVIKNRKSTRKFSDKKVLKEDVIKMIESARLAPSAANRQNWYFLILEGDEKNKIVDIMKKHLDKERKVLDSMKHATKKYRPTSSLHGSIYAIKEAPILILALRKNQKEWIEGDYLSMGAAIENISLTATDLGIDTLWIRDVVYVRNKIIKHLKYNDMDLVSAIAVGYSCEVPYERKKKKLEDIMKWV